MQLCRLYKRSVGVGNVVVDLGEGNDKLDASALGAGVRVQAQGGTGDDLIMLGAGGGSARRVAPS